MDKIKKGKNKIAGYFNLAFSFLLFVFLVSSCGYRLETKGDLPFNVISVGKIENRTHEPKLEDGLNRILSETLMEYGFRIDKSARYRIEIDITRFELATLSEKELTATEYGVDIRGKFRLADTEKGRSTPAMDIRNPFATYFSTTGKLVNVLAQKEVSVNSALKDISQEIVRQIIYNKSQKWEAKNEKEK